MARDSLTWKEANELLKGGYPPLPDARGQFLQRFPFAEYLRKLWRTDKDYPRHGPEVLGAMNALLSPDPGQVIKAQATTAQRGRLQLAVDRIHHLFGWDESTETLFRVAALYHDIGKYIIKERHPTIGWYIMQYIDPVERERLRRLVNDDDKFRLLMIILRDHDQFGVLSTGEGSYPILLRAAASGDCLEAQKRVISALMLVNLADIAGTFDADGYTTDTLIQDWEWFLAALEQCSPGGPYLDEQVIREASRPELVCERIRRLLKESSRDWPERRQEVGDKQVIRDHFETVFGGYDAMREFASDFTHVCKLDYGKRFFEGLMEFCEGPPKSPEEKKKRRLPCSAPARMSSHDVVYAVFAILKRITTTYAAMTRSDTGPGNLIGVELKDLAPTGAPEKTAQIVNLVLTGHYPGLTWMMSDAPAWYF